MENIKKCEINFRITKELRDEVKRLAKEQDRSVSSFVTTIIKEYIESHK